MNYFQLFQVPPQFDLDLTELGTRYLELQRNFHPDNFAAGSERDRLLAVQQAANINDAYHSLKQPLLRAEHLLALRGVKISHEQRSFTDTNFLFDTMSYGVPIGFGALLAELIRGESKLIDKKKSINKKIVRL